MVVWLAAIVGDGACALNPDLTVDLNDRAVGRLAEQFDGRIIFTSTCSVYGANDEVLDESSAVNPLSIYAQTKLAAEGHLIGKNAITFRLGTLFGVSDHFSRIRMDLAVNVLTAKAYVYRKISVFGGNQYRPLLHVKDVGAAIVQTLETAHTGVFNLHAVNMQIVDLAEEVSDRIDLYEVGAITDAAKQLGECLAQAGAEVAKAAAGLDELKELGPVLQEIHRLENEGDAITRRALQQLFDENPRAAASLIKWKDVYALLESTLDECEEVAEIIETIAIKNA